MHTGFHLGKVANWGHLSNYLQDMVGRSYPQDREDHFSSNSRPQKLHHHKFLIKLCRASKSIWTYHRKKTPTCMKMCQKMLKWMIKAALSLTWKEYKTTSYKHSSKKWTLDGKSRKTRRLSRSYKWWTLKTIDRLKSSLNQTSIYRYRDNLTRRRPVIESSFKGGLDLVGATRAQDLVHAKKWYHQTWGTSMLNLLTSTEWRHLWGQQLQWLSIWQVLVKTRLIK